MFRHFAAAASLAVMLSPFAVQAAEKTVALDIQNATCALCGPIVKQTLLRVSGVKAVQFKDAGANSDAVATVTFDDSVTSMTALVAATGDAGYPSHMMGSGG